MKNDKEKLYFTASYFSERCTKLWILSPDHFVSGTYAPEYQQKEKLNA